MFLSNETTRKACLGLLTATALGWATTGALAQEALVTPELIGRADAPITLTIQPRFAYSHQSNDKNRRAVLTEAFEAWIRRHPDVKIEVQVQQGDDAVIVAKRLQDAAAGRAADAIMVEDLDYRKFYDLTASIDPFLTETEKSDFLPGVLEGMKHPTTGEVKYLQIWTFMHRSAGGAMHFFVPRSKRPMPIWSHKGGRMRSAICIRRSGFIRSGNTGGIPSSVTQVCGSTISSSAPRSPGDYGLRACADAREAGSIRATMLRS